MLITLVPKIFCLVKLRQLHLLYVPMSQRYKKKILWDDLMRDDGVVGSPVGL